MFNYNFTIVEFSKITKSNIFKILVNEWLRVFNAEKDDQAINMLDSIWDLRAMESTDNRYNDAYGDVIQHYFNNQDWDTDYLFTERLQLYGESTDFQKFIGVMLAPEHFNELDYLMGVSSLVDTELERDRLRLVIEEYNDLGLPRQKVYPIAEVSCPDIACH